MWLREMGLMGLESTVPVVRSLLSTVKEAVWDLSVEGIQSSTTLTDPSEDKDLSVLKTVSDPWTILRDIDDCTELFPLPGLGIT